jgi:hypothetical protein
MKSNKIIYLILFALIIIIVLTFTSRSVCEGFKYVSNINWVPYGDTYISSSCVSILNNEGENAFLEKCTNENDLNKGVYTLSNNQDVFMNQDENYSMGTIMTRGPDTKGDLEYNGKKYNWSYTYYNIPVSPSCLGPWQNADRNHNMDFLDKPSLSGGCATKYNDQPATDYKNIGINIEGRDYLKRLNLLPDGTSGIMTAKEQKDEYDRQMSPKIIKAPDPPPPPPLPSPLPKSTNAPLPTLSASDTNVEPKWVTDAKNNIKCNEPKTASIIGPKIDSINKIMAIQKNKMKSIQRQIASIDERYPIKFHIGKVNVNDDDSEPPSVSITGGVPDLTLNFTVNPPLNGLKGKKGNKGDVGIRGISGSGGEQGITGYWNYAY